MENKPVQENAARNSDLKKAGKSFASMIKRLFVREKDYMSILEEEALQTPGKTIMKNFFRQTLGVVGLVVFILVLCFSFIGSRLNPIDLTYVETSLRNIRPSQNFLNYPKELVREGVKQVSSGISFSLGLSEKGKVYVWGAEPSYIMENYSTPVLKIPQEVRDNEIVQVAAGDRFALALDAQGRLYGWGVNNFKQAEVPDALQMRLSRKKVAEILGGEQYAAVLFEDGEIFVWGCTMPNQLNKAVPEGIQGRIKKAVAAPMNVILLLDDGTVATIGIPSNTVATVPEELTDGSVNVVEIAASYRAVMALDDKGKLYAWGNMDHGVLDIPDYDGKVVAMDAGKNNFTMLLDTGKVVYWGADHFGQLKMPAGLEKQKVTQIYTDYFQNYAITEDGAIRAWGNKGFVFGTDEQGRDILTRIIHGGRISLTVGAIAVVIEVIIALIVGLSAGFFGGWLDNALMRLTDIFMSIPFLPIAITLSSIVVGKVSEMNRIYMIMVILGVLGWMGLARLVRAQILVEREKDFVLAARALGVKQKNIIVRHILPNVFNLVIVNITLGYAGSLLSEAGLSFLGFGVAPPTPSWGNMLTTAQSTAVIEYYWWRWVIPGLFVFIAALSINLVGDALREAMDPRASEK